MRRTGIIGIVLGTIVIGAMLGIRMVGGLNGLPVVPFGGIPQEVGIYLGAVACLVIGIACLRAR